MSYFYVIWVYDIPFTELSCAMGYPFNVFIKESLPALVNPNKAHIFIIWK